ncbi:MAG: SRPBCC family protein [Flavobacteriales bacterium]|nr:SRPBCC family protein [Flavobacteriales bacterium]
MKRIVLILSLFAIIVVIISIFLPSSFHMDRKIVINADKEQVFKQVNDLKNWKNWSSWALEDPSIYENIQAFSDISFGKGASFSWDSENDKIGKGSLKIIESTLNTSIKNETNFGFIESKGTWSFNDVENGVEVVWGMDVDFGFNPLSKFFGLFMEDKIAPDFELGLERLKSFAENLPKINSVIAKKERMKNDLWFLSIRDTLNPREMNNVHGKIYSEINQYLKNLEVVNQEAPIVIYYSWFDTICDIEVGIPVLDTTLIGNGRIKMNKIASTNVVTAIHYGAYDRLPETYFGINEWMRKNKVRVTGHNWEVYLIDPATEPSPEKWETAIYFPIE